MDVKLKLLELENKIIDLEHQQYLLYKKYLDDAWEFEIDYFWGCEKSPFGLCAYHRFEDRAHDDCIFCHQPQERK